MKTTKIIASTLVAGAIAGCSPGGEHLTSPRPQEAPITSSPQDATFEAYLPTWLTPEQNERIANLAPRLGGVTLAFALPQPSGELQMPSIEDMSGLKKIISRLPTKATVSLALGGWGADDQGHEAILQGFKAAAQDPERFAIDTQQVIKELHEKLGREIDAVDIDWEFPSAKEAPALARLIGSLHRSMPDKKLSLAVPAYDHQAGLTAALQNPNVRAQVDALHVMTYDQHGPWDKVAGELVSHKWAETSIANWVALMGAQKVSPGFATYCYRYIGATAKGQAFTASQEIAYNELPANTLVTDNPNTLASETIVKGDWTSCQSPRAVAKLNYALRQAHPTLAKSFFWDANGLHRTYLGK